jgi:hypothetical protein
MRQGIDIRRIVQAEPPRHFDGFSRFGDALDDLAAGRTGIGDDRGSKPAGGRREEAGEDGLGVGAQQRSELGIPVQIEEDQFAAVGGEAFVEGGNDRPGADREAITD